MLTPPSPRSPVRSPQLGRPKLGMAGRQSSLCPNEIASENLLTPPSPLAARGMLGRQPPKLGVTGKQYSLSPNELLPPRSPMLGRQLSLCSPTRGALRRQNTIDPYSGKVCSSLNTISLKKKVDRTTTPFDSHFECQRLKIPDFEDFQKKFFSPL